MAELIDLEHFKKLRDRYLACVDREIKNSDGYSKGRDFIVNISMCYAREDTFLVSKTDKWQLDIPSYQFERVDKYFDSYCGLIQWFERYIEELERGLDEPKRSLGRE